MDFKSEIREEQNKQQLTIDPINWNDNYHHIEPQYRELIDLENVGSPVPRNIVDEDNNNANDRDKYQYNDYYGEAEQVSIYDHELDYNSETGSVRQFSHEHAKETNYIDAIKALMCPNTSVEIRDSHHQTAQKHESKQQKPRDKSEGVAKLKNHDYRNYLNSKKEGEYLAASIWQVGKYIKKRKRQRFYSQGRERRKSSVERVITELEDFKIEISRRFTKSIFNHTYKFPRK